MAVMGLSIPISADTKSFNKGMKKMDRNVRATSKNVRELSKSLKIEWNNDRFLEAQKNAKTAIGQTEEKAKSLRKRLEYLDEVGTDKSSAEYKKLQSEIVKTESKAVLLRKKLEKINALKFDRISKKLKKVGSNLSSMGQQMTQKVTMPILAIGAAALKMAVDLDTGLRKVSTLFGDVNVDTENLKKQVQDLSVEAGIAATELSEGLYQALSAGVVVTEDMTEAMEFLKIATDLSIGGFTTTVKAVDAMTTVMNSYGMEVSEAARISDMFIATQNKGKTTVDKLASSMSKVIPTAVALGVEFEGVMASLAGLTAKGFSTAEAATSLKQVFAQLAKSSTTASTVLREQTGKSFKVLSEEGTGLGEIFKELVKGAEGSEKAMVDVFGSMEAFNAFSTMAARGGEGFKIALDAIINSSGATSKAVEDMTGPARRFKMAVQSLAVALQGLGDIFTPVLVKLAGKISDLATKFNELDKSTKVMIVRILAITAVIGPLLFIVGKLTIGVGLFIAIIPKLKGALNSLGGALKKLGGHPIILTIMIVVGLLAYLYKTNEDFKKSVDGLVKQLGSALMPIVNSVISIFKTLMKVIMPIIGLIGDMLVPVFQVLGAILMPLLKLILMPMIWQLEIMAKLWKKIADWITPLVKVIRKKLIPVFDKLKTMIENIPEYLKMAFDLYMGYIGKIIVGAEWVVNQFIGMINRVIRGINRIGGLFDKTVKEINDVEFDIDPPDMEANVKPIVGDIDDVELAGSSVDIVGGTGLKPLAGSSNVDTPKSPVDVIRDTNVQSTPETTINQDNSDKDITINVTVENYAEEVDIDEMVEEINLKLAREM